METARESAETGRSTEPEIDQDTRGLEFLWLELTGKCNLQCVHCYAESGPMLPMHGMMNVEDWQGVLEDAYGLGCRQVQFIGGEPTIYPHLVQLIEFARATGFNLVEVFTNGTHLTEKLKTVFREQHVALAFSIYSVYPAIHDSVTLRAGSFLKTLHHIRWALNAGLPVRAGIIDVGVNSASVEETRRFVEQLGVTSVGVDRVRGVGRGIVAGGVAYDPIRELCGECWKRKLCVTQSGEVFPCVFSRFVRVGNVTDGLANILRGTTLLSFRSTLKAERQPLVAQCYPERTCSPDTSCTPAYCNPKYDQCNPKCTPHTCGPNCNPSHGGNCEPTCKPSYRPFG